MTTTNQPVNYNQLVSNCCKADLKANTSDEGTGFYSCLACQKACNAFDPSRESIEVVINGDIDENEQIRAAEHERIYNLILDIEIGKWWCFCCEEDLKQITSEKERLEAIESILDPDFNDTFSPNIWKTKEEALVALNPKKT